MNRYKFLFFNIILILIITLLFLNFKAFAQSLPHEIVDQAINKTLLDISNPELRVIQQGSHISGINFRPFTDPNPSDYDSRLFIARKDISKLEALEIWKKFRFKLQQNLIAIAKLAEYDSNTIGKLRSLVNFYPPEQLIKQFNTDEEAAQYFLRQGLYPNLGEVGEEGIEGLFSKFTRFIRQSFEESPRVRVSQLAIDANGEWMVIHKTSAEAEHMLEGKAPKNLRGFIQAAEHAIEEVKKALKKGQHEIAEKQINRASDALKGARSLVNVSTESELLEKMNSLENVFQQLKSKAFSDNGISAKEYLSTIDDIAKKLKPIESELIVETSALKGLKEAKNPKTRWLLKGLLENDNKFLELKSKLVILSDDAISKGLTKEFALWFGTTLLDFWNLKQLDDALKKGEVGLSNIVIPSLLNYLYPPTTPFGWATLFSEIYMATVSLAVQYVESTGYSALIKNQDCMDLIAGIYTLKGREQRIFEKKCEEIVDSQMLACRIYDQHGLRKSLLNNKFNSELVPPLLNSILKCHAENAAIHYDEMNQSKHDERIAKALIEKCRPIIINEWFEARQIVVNDLDLLRQSLADLELKMIISPDKIKKDKRITVEIDEKNIDNLEKEIKEKIKCLGGIHSEPKFNRSYKWFLNGKEIETSYKSFKDIVIEKEGNHEVCADVKYEWYVSGLPEVSLEEGISGNVIKKVCAQITVSDGGKKSCTYTYSEWSECDPKTGKRTRKLISKTPKDCIEKEKPVLEQSCTPAIKDEEKEKAERERLEKERIEHEKAEKEKIEREQREAERKKAEEEKSKEAPTCSYEYSNWGECDRATKKQTRTVIAKKPEGCIEKEKPVLEQSCTPPPTEEEQRRALFNCICKYSYGIVGAHYHPEPVKGYSPSCDDTGNGPCMGGEWGCYRYFMSYNENVLKYCFGIDSKDKGDSKYKDEYLKAVSIIKEENKKFAKPLSVKIKASKNPADFGDIVELTAETIGGTGGYKWSWSGCAQDAKDAAAKVVNTRTCTSCTASVTVTDQDGNTASDSLLIQCNNLRVKLTKENPKENKIPIGGKATFLAEVFSGDKPYSGPTLSYLWERNPDVLFGDPKNPQYELKGGSQMRNSAIFKKTGTIPVWVVVRREIDGVWRTVGESEQIQIEVVNPELSIKASPEKPMVGQEVKLEVSTNPPMGDDLVSFWWDIPGYFSGTGNKVAFKPKDTKPIKAVVHAKSKDNGEEIGTKEITITAQGYQVSISEPRYLGPKPMIWKCDTQFGGACPGLVEVGDTQFAVFRDIFMKATVTPAPDSPRYRWSIDPAGSCGFPGAGSEIKINCSSTGTYTVRVEVTNDEGIKLGEAVQTVTISISDEMLKASTKSKEAYEKLQQAKRLVNEGKLDEAINLANEAVSLDPKNSEAKTLKDKWAKDKEQIIQHINNVNKLIKEKKFQEAEREIQGAKALHPKYVKVVEAEKLLNEAKQRHQKEVTDRLNEAKRLAKEGKIDEAVKTVQEVAKIDKTSAQTVMHEVSAEAKKAGWDALSKGDYKTAIKRLEQAVALNPADVDAQNKLKGAKDYEAKMPQVEAKMKEFERLIEEKRIVSSYKKLLEVQDILRTMALGQSSYNPVIIKYNEEYNKLNKWYNELIQKTNAELQNLMENKEWAKAEALLMDVLKYEHTEANKKNYDSALQVVRSKIIQEAKIQKQREIEAQKQAKADQLWNECIELSKQNRLNEALGKCKESLNHWSDDKRRQAVASLESEITNQAKKKAQADKLWNDCIAMVKQNRLNDAAPLCEQSLNYWTNDERRRALNELKTKVQQANEVAQRKATADKLWNECIELSKQNRLNEALARCKESLNYWSSDKRLAAVKDLENKLNQRTLPSEPPLPPVSTSEVASRRIILEDSFDMENNGKGALNYNSFSKWIVKDGTVDLIGNGFYDFVPGRGLYVDLDGSTNKAGLLETRQVFQLDPGQYILSFDLAGSQRGDTNTVTVKLGNVFSENITFASNEPMRTIKRTINVSSPTSGTLSFKNSGGDNYGLLLDNVRLERVSTFETGSYSSPPQTVKGKVIFNNGNTASVYNNPTRPTTFTINQPYVITLIQNYHWNNSRGSNPGTIALRDQSGRIYGPWQATGSPGQGGVPNAYWNVYTNVTLPAGIYTVIDSEPSTWAQNSGSNGAGHTRIEGYPISTETNITEGMSSGTTISSTIQVRLKNNSNQNVHLYPEGGSPSPNNRITPGETRTINIPAPTDGFLRFCAGRDGQTIQCNKKAIDPNDQSRTYTVIFDEANPFNKVIIETAMVSPTPTPVPTPIPTPTHRPPVVTPEQTPKTPYYQVDFTRKYTHKRLEGPWSYEGIPLLGYKGKAAPIVWLTKCKAPNNDGVCYPKSFQWDIDHYRAKAIYLLTHLSWWGDNFKNQVIARVNVVGSDGSEKTFDLIEGIHTAEWNGPGIKDNPPLVRTVYPSNIQYSHKRFLSRFDLGSMIVKRIKIELLDAPKVGSDTYGIIEVTAITLEGY